MRFGSVGLGLKRQEAATIGSSLSLIEVLWVSLKGCFGALLNWSFQSEREAPISRKNNAILPLSFTELTRRWSQWASIEIDSLLPEQSSRTLRKNKSDDFLALTPQTNNKTSNRTKQIKHISKMSLPLFSNTVPGSRYSRQTVNTASTNSTENYLKKSDCWISTIFISYLSLFFCNQLQT